jgi:UBX domain-containing protein 7
LIAGIFSQRYNSASVWNNNDADADTHRRELSRATGGASESSAKANRLAEMFRPPFEIMSTLGWDEARDLGKEEEKWILVNVQDESIFACQVLNRDIWKDPEIKETIKENFVFLQYLRNNPQGNKYAQYYFHAREDDDAYPHIAIIDPRTGEQVKVWSGKAPKPMEFLMQLHEFLDRYSLRADARNPVAQRKPERKKVDVDRMTEEEMLEMALQNSLANGTTPRVDDPDELTKHAAPSNTKGKEKADVASIIDMDMSDKDNGDPSTVSTFASISSNSPHTEPAADPQSTTLIRFRFSGGTKTRRFALSDHVRRIYEWLKAQPLEGKEGLPFDLSSMGKNLLEHLDESIKDAGLKQSTVMVEFQEE